MSEVTVQYKHFESKKGSIRMSTDERLTQQYPLPDTYVPRTVLTALGLQGREQDNPELVINVTYTLSVRS